MEETEILLEQYLSPRKLKMLTGVDDLEEVTSLELKVNTTDTSLGNFGALLPNLNQLKLSGSVIHSIRDIGSSLCGVRVLWMSQCGLCEVDGISSMISLQEVYLPYNEISDISSLSMLDDLQVLDLEGNNIDDISQIEYLVLCPSLKRLTIEGNPVCTMRTVESEEVNYNYKEAVQTILPSLEILDDEPLIPGSLPSSSINAFDKDWEYLEELQTDSLFQSPSDSPDLIDDPTELTVLRPTTAYRPGSALRPSSGYRPLSASRRPATISGRPSTSVRPLTAFAERPVSSDAVHIKNDGGASALTQGGVICGNPSKALRERRKLLSNTEDTESLKDNKSNESIDSIDGKKVVDELKEWRQHHKQRMEKVQAVKTTQVLVIDHNSTKKQDSYKPKSVIKLNKDKILEHDSNISTVYGGQVAEVYDYVEDLDSEALKNCSSFLLKQSVVNCDSYKSSDTSKPKLNDISTKIPKTKLQRPDPAPLTSKNLIASVSTSRPINESERRIRRQLPQVPPLPSKPSAPKEETTVFVELNGLTDTEFLKKENVTCKVLGVDSDKPLLQVGSNLFSGEYKDSVGTYLLLNKPSEQEESGVKNVDYFDKTYKSLVMHRTFLNEKSENAGEGSSRSKPNNQSTTTVSLDKT